MPLSRFPLRRLPAPQEDGPSPRRRGMLGWMALAPLGVAPSARAADEAYPTRIITFVVPYAAGTPPDVYTRRFAERLQQRVGQNVIVENRPGALTTIGMGHVARSKPDGYTIVYGSNSSLAAAPALFRSITYDPVKDFSAIAVTSESPMILISRPEDAHKGFKGMLQQMRNEPGRHPIGGGAITQEVVNRLLQTQGGIDQPYVRYNNSMLNQDLLGGRLAMAVSALSGIVPLVESGKINVLAITGDKRLTGKWSHIPTVAETLPGFDVKSWTGFWVPSATPRSVVNYLHARTTEILREPEFHKRNEEGGALTVFMTPEETDRYVKTEGPRWMKLLKDIGIEPQ